MRRQQRSALSLLTHHNFTPCRSWQRNSSLPSPLSNRNPLPLLDAIRRNLPRPLARKHAVVGREGAADHPGLRGGVFLRACVGGEGQAGRVFSVVDAHDAVVAVRRLPGFVLWFRPFAAVADAWVCWVSGWWLGWMGGCVGGMRRLTPQVSLVVHVRCSQVCSRRLRR